VLPALSQASDTVPKGTAITVVTDQNVSSKDAKVGQTLTGTVAKDVVVGGKVVIPKGSAAKLSVSAVKLRDACPHPRNSISGCGP
jgi:hypothetical protein